MQDTEWQALTLEFSGLITLSNTMQDTEWQALMLEFSGLIIPDILYMYTTTDLACYVGGSTLEC